jgi:uncharacterized cupin superfamily protein
MDRRRFLGYAGLSPLAVHSIGSDQHALAKPLLVRPDGGHLYSSGKGETRILVGTEQSQGRWWLGTQLFEPGRKTFLHLHFGFDEQFYVLEGTLSLWLEDHWIDLSAGAIAEAPRRNPHALGNRTSAPLRFLLMGEPAGFERYFADLEVIVHRLPYASPEFLDELAKVYTKYDSKLLGPSPEG